MVGSVGSRRPCVAVFGGSFNPPHVAHQMACLYALETHPLDQLLVVPCFRHPFEKQLAPYPDRLAMCRLAMRPLGERVMVSEIEREIGGDVSRTVITLEALAAKYPGVDFRLVVGSDLIAEKDKWWRWPDIERLAPLLVIGRKGYPEKTWPGPQVELPEISSTEIRSRVAAGQPISSLVPRSVEVFIAEKKLYR
ncbi:MAG: nicotinate (nicotinamide) nucleotide adenylyltransferase [Deltaproteobacteria bacterium]|nr:nicotinate (nicotinamide) nucleotide adenylyltransferase [Deltaproteobacteria bacterium]